tara:strand:+ start:51 stop:605 length:555 start_codon:yes stop_codon:yes gene_type:complete
MTTFNTKLNLANFSRSLGNGITMGKEFAAGLHHAITTKNTNHLADLYSRAKAKNGGDSAAQRTIKATVIAIYSGTDEKIAKFEDPTDPAKGIVIKTKGCTINKDYLAALDELVKNKATMRGDDWKNTFSTKTETLSDPVKLAKALAKKLDDEKIEGGRDAMLAALVAELGGLALVQEGNIKIAA